MSDPTRSLHAEGEGRLVLSPTEAPDRDTIPAPTAPPPTLPGYEILGELGRGGMGVVYLARQVKAQRLVALKMILAGAHASRISLDRFRVEAEAAARVQHPNVAMVFEVGEQDGLPFFSMEYCGGGTLEARLRQGPLPPVEAARLVEALAQAMAVAHARGVVHRDLKPANVLLSDEGVPKIVDFGLARKLDEAGRTATGSVLGTPSYMAPEQADGRTQAIGPATDVYALGAILYECLTGRPPLRAATPMETLVQVLSVEPVAVRRLQPRVSVDLETICHKCLRKEPHRRYPGATALADDLHRCLAGEPIQARPVGRLERGWRYCRRHPADAAAAALGFILLAAVFVIPLVFGVIQSRNAERLAKQQKLTEEALKRSRESGELAETRLQAERRQSAVSTLERALVLCENGEAANGLLWLGRGLEMAQQAEAPDLEEDFRWNLAAWSREVPHLLAILPHADVVEGVCFSPDGTLAATACRDHSVRFWDLSTGREVGAPLEHPGPVLTVTFAPDGQTVLTGCKDGKVRQWSVAERRPTGVVLEHSGAIASVKFRADGKAVLTSSYDGTARLWSPATGQPLAPPIYASEPRADWSRGVRADFGPGGKTVLTAAGSGVVIWDARTSEQLRQTIEVGGYTLQLVLRPGTTTFAVTLLQLNSVEQRDLATTRPVGKSMPHRSPVYTLAYSSDGRFLVSGSEDQTAQAWDAASGTALGGPMRHAGTVTAIAIGPDDQTILTGSMDGTARLWRLPSRGLVRTLPLLRRAYSVARSPDGERILTGGWFVDAEAQLWDATTGQGLYARLQKRTTPGVNSDNAMLGVAFAPDGRTFWAAECQNETVGQWDVATGELLGSTPRHGEEVWSLALSPDGRTLVTGGRVFDPAHPECHARLWDARTRQPIGHPTPHGAAIYAVAFSPDSRVVATGSDDRTTRLWDAATGEPLGPPVRQAAAIWALAFSPDGRTILTGGADGNAQLWDVPTWQPRGVPMAHQAGIDSVGFALDGKIILTASLDGTARLWNAATGRPIGPPLRHGKRVRAILYSPGTREVLTNGDDSAIRLWEIPQPWDDDPERSFLRVQLESGLELDERGTVRVLSAERLRRERERLERSSESR